MRITNSLCDHMPWAYRVISSPRPAGYLETIDGLDFHLEVSAATCYCCARPGCQEAARTWVAAISGREATVVPL